ncbi:vWA domain-containing protein [Aciditerrimonas ferrireducens]|uniref:vWA domain-containing protein n=1 Tax=Aciditerrimonas ferrireducens TaxID=667306 RepID=UPI00200428D5|nr:VWA domain-containing protein [Aciditerrimonas ferrireducens]MCK4176192.1 VWA domain-containing protein [Aciditerrimonas ferrireducens]
MIPDPEARGRPSRRWAYRRWDGSQRSPLEEADELFASLADELLYHGDPQTALRRRLLEGFEGADGERVLGLRELLERLRAAREAELARGDLGGAYREIAEQLEEVVAEERAELERLRAQADAGDERQRSVSLPALTERQLALDLLPDDLAGRFRGLQQYEFTSAEAQRRFEELAERLRQELAQSWFQEISQALANPDPAALQRTREMLDALNRMLEQRARGEELDPSFEAFMERFGDLFPSQPTNLDELLADLAAQLAAAQAALASLSPEQRAQLEALAEALFEDLDLAWQLDRLAANLREALPDAGWGRSYRFRGQDPLGLAEAAEAARRLGELDQLEQFLRGATAPGALAEVDLEQVARHLGEDAARSLDRLAALARRLEEAGLIAQREGRYELTAAGVRRIGQRALGELFQRLEASRLGSHPAARLGQGHDREGQTRPYAYGDPLNLDIERTLRNALRRRGPGTPVRLAPEDFEVAETEALERTSTVLLVDLSLSMPMRDNFLAAKKVALALHTLISTRFPRDFLGLVGFSEVARELRPEDLPTVSWDFVYGTNMQHGLLLARRMLAHRPGSRQVIMITDGEPTAHLVPEASGDGYEVFFNYPPVPETVRATLAEVVRCTRASIRINTFMLDASRGLRGFVDQMTRLNGGRAFYTTPEDLGDYVLVDFLEHHRRARRLRGA